MIRNYISVPSWWEAAKGEIRDYLIEVAQSKRQQIFYSELTAKVRSVDLIPHDQRLAALLGEISTEEYRAGRGMLSAVVIHKHDGMPGQGFFDLARFKLGRIIRDKLEFWVNEFERVCSYWRTH